MNVNTTWLAASHNSRLSPTLRKQPAQRSKFVSRFAHIWAGNVCSAILDLALGITLLGTNLLRMSATGEIAGEKNAAFSRVRDPYPLERC